MAKARKPRDIDSLRHNHATRRNIPTAEFQSIMRDEDKSPVRIAYERRNRDLDPQLVWRGKSDGALEVAAPPLYIQEKVHRVRAILDEIFQTENLVSQIQYRALTPLGPRGLSNVYDYVLWFAKSKELLKYRNIQLPRPMEDEPEFCFKDDGSGHYAKLAETPKDSERVFKLSDLKSSGYTPTCIDDFDFEGHVVKSKGRKSWRTNSKSGLDHDLTAEMNDRIAGHRLVQRIFIFCAKHDDRSILTLV